MQFLIKILHTETSHMPLYLT